VTEKDSTQLYEHIEDYAGRKKFTKFLHQLVFKPTGRYTSTTKKTNTVPQKSYDNFEGKIIRQIHIETLDPFGYSIDDTTAMAQGFLSKTGNKLHAKSTQLTIRNLLLTRKNQPFDALRVKESERLIRSMDYVTDVSFYVKTTSENSDSVDIFIRVLDIWSLIPMGSTSTSATTIGLTDRNFLGLGHEFQNTYTRKYQEGTNAFASNYSIPNIRSTYISTRLHYGIDKYGNYSKMLGFDRPFFSPLAKWAAGVNFSHRFRNDSIMVDSMVFVPQQFKFNTQDYWVGSAIQIFKGNSEFDRTTNFISSLRFLRIRYLEKPSPELDAEHVFTNENFYLASIGISTRLYVQDKYIFRFGITEDVPTGKVISLTGGYQDKSYYNRFYFGARVSFGNYNSWGYLGSNFEYGNFLNSSKVEQGVFRAGVTYFTKLFEIGKWKFRQFVKPQLTLGINRFSADSLTINNNYGLEGFKSLTLFGTNRMLLTLQTQSYAPYNLFGFRFGPFLNLSFGMLGDAASGFKNSKLYSQIGLGVLIRNENLVISTFQLSVAYYPDIPGKGQNLLMFNSYKTTDFGFQDFEIGKPETVLFR
jgi:hypothetical protein